MVLVTLIVMLPPAGTVDPEVMLKFLITGIGETAELFQLKLPPYTPICPPPTAPVLAGPPAGGKFWLGLKVEFEKVVSCGSVSDTLLAPELLP